MIVTNLQNSYSIHNCCNEHNSCQSVKPVTNLQNSYSIHNFWCFQVCHGTSLGHQSTKFVFNTQRTSYSVILMILVTNLQNSYSIHNLVFEDKFCRLGYTHLFTNLQNSYSIHNFCRIGISKISSVTNLQNSYSIHNS